MLLARTPLRVVGSADRADRFIVLTYGMGTDWYQNLINAPGHSRVEQTRFEVSNPRLVTPDRAKISNVLRAQLRLASIEHLVRVSMRSNESEPSTPTS